ncbi:hypothetical protein P1X14_09285 [Sphingomonas sp. AOB5]|uniref:hypothetical protein n=1 Tax=Sphingomonas sp. AOB5 TaxID=3034017 RepID=UPI0023FA2C9D|nr:hypothetical protein [Sphingomonas sp. AOB5]MDF7775439.1 hypothetical protein [Sphingomonas sp. AOB5]
MSEDVTGSMPRTILIWGLASLAALWLGLTALGGVMATPRPSVAAALFPANGFAYERLAANEATRESENLKDIKLSQASLDDALNALRHEPLASTALTLIGLSRGTSPDAAKIIIRANAMDKHQLVANAWLINHYGTEGRARPVLNLLDEALRVNPGLSERYMPALAQALIDPQTLPVLQQMLGRKPGWAPSFWQAVTGNPASLPNAEVLRARMLAGAEELGQTDELLMAAFVAARRMDLALSYQKHLKPFAEDNGNLVRNSSFNEVTRLAPLDWELSSDGRVSAAIDEGRGVLEMNAISGSSAVAARQLIAIPPGNYVLYAKLGQQSLGTGSDIQVRVHCAEAISGTQPRLDVGLTSDVERAFVIPEGSPCRFYWVEVELSAIDAPGPVLALLAELRIVRGRAQPSSAPLPTPAATPAP